MAIISNGTTVASGGSVRGSASNLSNIPAPSNSQILSGVASVSAGAVGCYGLLLNGSGSATSTGSTASGLDWANTGGQFNSTGTSGTWRQMGHRTGDSNERKTTLYLRIS